MPRIIPGQRRKKLDEGQTASMIKMAAQNPTNRKQHIEYSVVNHARLVNDPCATAFQMKINPKMLEVRLDKTKGKCICCEEFYTNLLHFSSFAVQSIVLHFAGTAGQFLHLCVCTSDHSHCSSLHKAMTVRRTERMDFLLCEYVNYAWLYQYTICHSYAICREP